MRKKKILLITQNEPIYIYDSIFSLLEKLPHDWEITHSIIGNQNPTGKKLSFSQKVLRVFYTFGLVFFVRYSLLFVYSKLKRNDLFALMKKNNIEIIKTPNGINHHDVFDRINDQNFDLAISIAGSEIFKPKLFSLFKFGIINIHTSDLPKYKGLMPVFRAMQKGETQIGISLFLVDEGIDTGRVLLKEYLDIEHKSMHTVIRQSKKIAISMIFNLLNDIENKIVLDFKNINEEGSYFSFPTKKDILEFKARRKRFF